MNFDYKELQIVRLLRKFKLSQIPFKFWYKYLFNKKEAQLYQRA